MKINIPTAMLEAYISSVLAQKYEGAEGRNLHFNFVNSEFQNCIKGRQYLKFKSGHQYLVRKYRLMITPHEETVLVWFEDWEEPQVFNIKGENETPSFVFEDGETPDLGDLDIDDLYGNTNDSRFNPNLV